MNKSPTFLSHFGVSFVLSVTSLEQTDKNIKCGNLIPGYLTTNSILYPLPHPANFSLLIADALYLTPNCFLPLLNPAFLVCVPTNSTFQMPSYFSYSCVVLCAEIEIFCSIYDLEFIFHIEI